MYCKAFKVQEIRKNSAGLQIAMKPKYSGFQYIVYKFRGDNFLDNCKVGSKGSSGEGGGS